MIVIYMYTHVYGGSPLYVQRQEERFWDKYIFEELHVLIVSNLVIAIQLCARFLQPCMSFLWCFCMSSQYRYSIHVYHWFFKTVLISSS